MLDDAANGFVLKFLVGVIQIAKEETLGLCFYSFVTSFVLKMCATTSSLSSVNSLLDEMLNRYANDIRNEVRLINEIQYPLSRNYFISTGFSVARWFLPVVKISRQNKRSQNVSFTNYQWSEFLKCEEKIKSHTSTAVFYCNNCQGENCEEVVELDDLFKLKYSYELHKSKMQPTIRICGPDVELVLEKAVIQMLLKVLKLVTNRLQSLEELNFAAYYSSLLNMIIQNNGGTSSEEMVNYVDNIIGLRLESNSEYITCLGEICCFHLNRLQKDISLHKTT